MTKPAMSRGRYWRWTQYGFFAAATVTLVLAASNPLDGAWALTILGLLIIQTSASGTAWRHGYAAGIAARRLTAGDPKVTASAASDEEEAGAEATPQYYRQPWDRAPDANPER